MWTKAFGCGGSLYCWKGHSVCDGGQETGQKICSVGWVKALGQQLDHGGLCLSVKGVRQGVPVPVSLMISVFYLAAIKCKKTHQDFCCLL